MEILPQELTPEIVKQVVIPPGSISRLEWQQLLLEAAAPELEVLVANHRDDDITDDESVLPADYPPMSTAARILAILYERFLLFDENTHKPLNIINRELTAEGLLQLESILLELAHLNIPDPDFIDWMELNTEFINPSTISEGIILNS